MYVLTSEPAAVAYSEVEVKSTFNGGDVNSFAAWANGQYDYPEQAKQTTYKAVWWFSLP